MWLVGHVCKATDSPRICSPSVSPCYIYILLLSMHGHLLYKLQIVGTLLMADMIRWIFVECSMSGNCTNRAVWVNIHYLCAHLMCNSDWMVAMTYCTGCVLTKVRMQPVIHVICWVVKDEVYARGMLLTLNFQVFVSV